MAAKEEKSSDFYAVLGLEKECSASELRNAYKKLALTWHPDRCSASGNSTFIEESKKKFQAIQEAYSVLSDANKRVLYDIGIYESDDDENGMGDFLGEMAVMMSQTRPSGIQARLFMDEKTEMEDVKENFEDLQVLFEEMFQKDMEAFNYTSQSSSSNTNKNDTNTFPFCTSSSSTSYDNSVNSNNKRNCSDTSSGKANSLNFRNFCLGSEGSSEDLRGRGRRRTGRKQKVSSRQDVSSHDSKISVYD